MKVRFMTPAEIERMMNARPLRIATHSAFTARHTASGNALDWLNLSATERAQADRRLGCGVRVARNQWGDDLDLSEYVSAVETMAANLGRVLRAAEAGGLSINDLAGVFEDMKIQGAKWLDQLQAEVSSGLQNSYVRGK